MRKLAVKQWCQGFAICLAAILFSFVPPAEALTGFSPEKYEARVEYGQGVYFAPYEVKIYTEPSEEAPLLETFHWNRQSSPRAVTSYLGHGALMAPRLFLSFYPDADVAMMAVVSENGEGWAEVVYDQPTGRTGWVQLGAPSEEAPLHFGRFQTWQNFMKLNAKKSGIYWLSGVDQYHRNIRSTPEDGAKFVPVTVMRNLKVKHVRGNWLLVEVQDFSRQTPLGWLRWRDDDGRLMMFTNFTGKNQTIVTSMF